MLAEYTSGLVGVLIMKLEDKLLPREGARVRLMLSFREAPGLFSSEWKRDSGGTRGGEFHEGSNKPFGRLEELSGDPKEGVSLPNTRSFADTSLLGISPKSPEWSAERGRSVSPDA